MPRKKTTRSKNHERSQAVQKIRVVTPTIVWNHSLSFLFSAIKYSVIIIAVGCMVFFGWKFIQRTFIQNAEYQLRVVKLNPNDVMNEVDVVRVGKIPLNNSIFDVDVEDVQKNLSQCPEIISAKVKRELPNMIHIELETRKPIAWIHCPAKNMIAFDRTQGVLIDGNHCLYLVPTMQFEAAKKLPIIDLTNEDAPLLGLGKPIVCKRLNDCLKLLDISKQIAGEEVQWISRISQTEKWAFTVQTKDFISATFGLTDQERQMQDLLTSMKHAGSQGLQLATINLIPSKNIPVTFRNTQAIRAVPNVK